MEEYFEDHDAQFMAPFSSGAVNSTELVAALINPQKDDLVAGIQYAQSKIDGSLTLLIMTEDGDTTAARDLMGPLCRCSWAPTMTVTALPSRALPITSWAITTSTSWARRRSCGLRPMPLRCLAGTRRDEDVRALRGCTTATRTQLRGYEREVMRATATVPSWLRRGSARRVPRGGLRGWRARFRHPHAIGYSTERARCPFGRPFIEYTPTWPRSFMPANQDLRNKIANMKQVPVPELIQDKKLLFVDDSLCAHQRCARDGELPTVLVPLRCIITAQRVPAHHVQLQVSELLVQQVGHGSHCAARVVDC